jgi:5-dehydro-4-deoxyglucarate dehydratase
MNREEFLQKLPGVIAFPVTPFNRDLSLDVPGLRSNLQHLMRHRMSAVVAAGGTGEIYSLSVPEHLQVVRATVEEVGGRAPVIAGAAYNLPIGVEMARQSAAAGADAILAFPPYYLNADWDALLDYYAAIGAATSLPMLIYSRDWVSPSPEWVSKIAAAVPTLAAWKDGQGDIRRYQQIMQHVGNRLYWIGGIGDDCVPGYYGIGIRTYTSSIATVAPRLSLSLHEAAAAGDAALVTQLMSDYVIPLYTLRTRRKGFEVSIMKEMMNLAGLRGGAVRPPLPNVGPEETRELRRMLERWEPMLDASIRTISPAL